MAVYVMKFNSTDGDFHYEFFHLPIFVFCSPISVSLSTAVEKSSYRKMSVQKCKICGWKPPLFWKSTGKIEIWSNYNFLRRKFAVSVRTSQLPGYFFNQRCRWSPGNCWHQKMSEQHQSWVWQPIKISPSTRYWRLLGNIPTPILF